MPSLKDFFTNRSELALILGVMMILVVLFSPIPPIALDLAIIVNFGLSLTILLMTLHVAKPVEFSTFPSLLLISTLLRLSLNIAATRLILTSGYAGDVINSIGSHAVGGNFVVGLVVFFILVVVQYVVVTSGAQRVSEVAARFTLDSMPGQQMSIDADLNMGLIDQKEAVARRSALEKEASFYGAMDGASKFVKGDAIAGVIILLIDIIAGWIIGVAQMGMGWSEALQHFTLLTIGDGIATQLPALIISTATGIIVTRSSADRELSTELFQQLTSAPRIPLIVAGMLTLLLLLPGMPKWPLLLSAGLGFLAWRQVRRGRAALHSKDEAPREAEQDGAPTTPAIIGVALGSDLAKAWKSEEALILDRIATLREAQQKALGVAFPTLKLTEDEKLDEDEYEVRIFGVRHASARINLGCSLAIRGASVRRVVDGASTVDPAFGLPAVWIEEQKVPGAREAGYTVVDPLTVFVTHLGEVLRAEAPALLTRGRVTKLLEELRSGQSGLVEELIPNYLSVSDLQRILQNLLAESVSIASIELIVEHLVDLARTEKDLGVLTELLRGRMGAIICNNLRERHRDLAVLSLDPRLENRIQSSLAAAGKRDALGLDPRLADQLLRRLATSANEMLASGRQPVLLCGADLRRPLHALARRAVPKLSIISVAEIPMSMNLQSHAVINLEEGPANAERRPTAASERPELVKENELRLH